MTVYINATPFQKLHEARLRIQPFQTSIPVDVNAIASELGLSVWEFKTFPEAVSGKLFRDGAYGGPSGWSVGVNAHEPYQRKRFTVAHEIAHFLLHRDKINDELSDDTFYRSKLLSSSEEHQANRLAAEILMPFHLIQRLQDKGMKDIESLAEKLQVSPTAMKIRLGVPTP